MTFIPFVSRADEVRLLSDPGEAWQARINLIENAEETIDFSYYAFHDGEAENIFLGVLREAADRGVKVRVILDSFSHGLSRGKQAYLIEHPNIEVQFYQPFWERPRLDNLNRYYHDKILLIDGDKLLIGGRNLGDKYFDRGETQILDDRDVFIKSGGGEEGVVAKVGAYVDELWTSEHTGRPFAQKVLESKWISEAWMQKKLAEAQNEIEMSLAQERTVRPENFGRKINWTVGNIQPEKIEFHHDPIGEKRETNGTAAALYDEFRRAKKEVIINSPYVTPTKKMLGALEEAKNNGAKVKILTNSVANAANPFGAAGTRKYQNEFQKRTGAKFWEFQGPNNLHQKAYLIDDGTSVMGSFNLDSRSARFNTEILFVIKSEEFADQMREDIKRHSESALLVDEKGEYVMNGGSQPAELSFWKAGVVAALMPIVPLFAWAI